MKIRPYRCLSVQKDEIEKMVAEMKKSSIIRDNNNVFAFSIVLVKKKDGFQKLCINYRQLNWLTIKDKFPILLVDKLLDELCEAKFFFKLDLRSGYHQIIMNTIDVHKSAFKTYYGHYEFLVMPLG